MLSMAVANVVARAVTEVDFREKLSIRPDEVLGAFDLSASEIEALKHLRSPTLDEFARRLETY